MTIFQLIMLAVAAFFAYQVYMHIQNIDEEAEPESMKEIEEIQEAELAPSFDQRVEEADKVYMNDDIQKAKELLEEIVKEFPTMAEGMNKLAFVLSKLDEKEDAFDENMHTEMQTVATFYNEEAEKLCRPVLEAYGAELEKRNKSNPEADRVSIERIVATDNDLNLCNRDWDAALQKWYWG